jgi:AraC family transcriptional regulator
MSLTLPQQVRRLGAPRNYFHGRSYADLCTTNNLILFSRTTRQELQRATFELRPHHRCVLIFNLATDGIVLIDGIRTLLQPQHGLLILPFQAHTFPEIAAENVLWLILTFETDQLEWLEDFRGKVFPLDASTVDQLTRILALYRSPNEETSAQLLGLETSMLLARLRPLVRKPRGTPTSTDHAARALLASIDARLRAARGAPVSIGELATSLHISESRLRARFRAAFSTTLGSYVSNYRLHRVIELMRDTRLNLSEIAVELGFSDSASFARFFRTQTGTTAKDFRRRMLAMTAKLPKRGRLSS